MKKGDRVRRKGNPRTGTVVENIGKGWWRVDWEQGPNIQTAVRIEDLVEVGGPRAKLALELSREELEQIVEGLGYSDLPSSRTVAERIRQHLENEYVGPPVGFEHDDMSLCPECNIYGSFDPHRKWCSYG